MKFALPPRRLIPRWRRIASTLNMREAADSSKGTAILLDEDRFQRAMLEWERRPTSGLFGDILSFSLDSTMRDRVAEFARRVRDTGFTLSRVQRSFVSELLSENADSDESALPRDIQNQQVASLRKVLSANPANPLALLDLAQHQLTLGKGKEAERNVLGAQSLSPDSRIVLRTLARLKVHIDRGQDHFKVKEALRVIGKHPRTPNDPWLMAAEIALSEVAGVAPKFASKGLRFMHDRRAPLADVSELAGAIGNLELKAGNIKRARELFRVALVEPNDNVLAQAISQQSELGIEINQPSQRRVVTSAQEAQTLLAWNSLRESEAQRHALLWYHEEPFSSRPIQFLTTLFAIQCDYKSAEQYARHALVADPNDPGLLINLSYAQANEGRREESEATLKRLLRIDHARYEPVALATYGLIAMKRGDFLLGDMLYLRAMETFGARRDPALEVVCYAYYARASWDTDHPNKQKILEAAAQHYRKSPSTDAALVLTRLDAAIEAPEPIGATRKLTQWIFDDKANVLVSKHGVTRPGAPSLLIKGRD